MHGETKVYFVLENFYELTHAHLLASTRERALSAIGRGATCAGCDTGGVETSLDDDAFLSVLVYHWESAFCAIATAVDTALVQFEVCCCWGTVDLARMAPSEKESASQVCFAECAASCLFTGGLCMSACLCQRVCLAWLHMRRYRTLTL